MISNCGLLVLVALLFAGAHLCASVPVISGQGMRSLGIAESGGGRLAPLDAPSGKASDVIGERRSHGAGCSSTPGRARVQVGGVRAAFTRIWGKGTGAVQFPIESVSEQLAREQWQGDHVMNRALGVAEAPQPPSPSMAVVPPHMLLAASTEARAANGNVCTLESKTPVSTPA